MKLARPVVALRNLLYHAFVHLVSTEDPLDTSEASMPAEHSKDSFVYLCITKGMAVCGPERRQPSSSSPNVSLTALPFFFGFLTAFAFDLSLSFPPASLLPS